MRIILTLISFIFCAALQSQSYSAHLNEDFTISIKAIEAPLLLEFRDEFEQLPGFPKGTLANPSFKDFRNVTLADLDGDSINDILLATNNKLFAYSATTLLWEKTLSGVAIYPPSVADINQDGEPEIVQVTGGVPDAGRIYVLDKTGTDLNAWPISFNDHWILTAPVLSDLDGDNILEIVVLERDPPAGKVHVLKLDGTSFNSNWPVTLDGTPAVTPSIGDVDGDGTKDIIAYSTTTRYIFDLNGQAKMGFPLVTGPDQRYSFQSPLLIDFEADNTLEIVGATHGDTQNPDPQFYIMNHDGSDRVGWPIDIPENTWTFNTPTVVEIDGTHQIFMSRPIQDVPKEMLYGWDSDGNSLPGFPIEKAGGLEGIISVADVDNDDAFELVFGSNLIVEGKGFIHAYELDGSGEVEGFPIRPNGWTFMNGAAIDDVNGDGLMDLSVLTYTQNFGAATDSTYLHVYNLGVPYSPEKVLWSTYKGSNTRSGLIGEQLISSTEENPGFHSIALSILPNPVQHEARLFFEIIEADYYQIDLFDANGRFIQKLWQKRMLAGHQQLEIDLRHLQKGIYFITIRDTEKIRSTSKLIKL